MEKSNELLGSVTQDSVRTSARVIQSKMQTSVVTNPMPIEKRETTTEISIANPPKTPSQTKHIRIQWTMKEKKCFFDALNEHGRDFEQISRFINLKMKRKNPTEADYKTKDHVRQHYYQLFQKASKYLKFSDDVKKLAQELYVLINYGEMKKKLIMSSEKSFLKLRDLVYRGSVTVRVKGKNIKIKTPSCRALKKLNQLEGTNIEDIQLPQRIDVYIRPSNLESWTYVQKLSQNPRIKVSLTLQKRISSLISTLEQKWRSNNLRLQEKYLKSFNRQKSSDDVIEQSENDKNLIKNKEPHLCFHPPDNCKIFRPMIQLNELLSSYNICLNSYEVRIGAKKRSEEICMEKNAHIKDVGKNNAKRIRNDSFSEKINNVQIDNKKIKSEDQVVDDLGIIMQINHHENDSNDSDMKKIEVEMDLDDKKELNENDAVNKNNVAVKPKKSMITTLKNPKEAFPYKPLINEDLIRKIREGWTIENVGDLTIGDLYLMYGSDSKLVIEYKWNEIENQQRVNGNAISNKLKHLMTIASLVENPAGSSRVFEKNFIDLKEIGDNGVFRHPNNFHSAPNMNPRLKPHQWRSHQYRYRPDGIGDYFKNASNQNHVVKNLYQTPSTSSKQEVEEKNEDDNCSSTQKYSDEVTKILEDKIQNISKQPHFQCFSESSRSSIKSLLESLSVNSSKTSSSYEDNLASLRFWDNIHDRHSEVDIDNISLSSLLGHLDSLNGNRDDDIDD
ncbi:hypothetical protein PVAND_012618 [Polypedilum vanderplanki]|uniref:Myb-like domain-containing protein n=1 Tax=Polypedilum vanderplanki TaxID=319348 RepID=A0A9J6CN28_POLVA|nr:hypothetical protein PVAND_012618 [Polypedilum vanderplanki]